MATSGTGEAAGVRRWAGGVPTLFLRGRTWLGVVHLLIAWPLALCALLAAVVPLALWTAGLLAGVLLPYAALAPLRLGARVLCRPLPAPRAWRRLARLAARPALWFAPLLAVAWGLGATERALGALLPGVPVDSPYRPAARGPWNPGREPDAGRARSAARAWFSARAADPAARREVGYLLLAPLQGAVWCAGAVNLAVPPLLLALAPVWYGASEGRPVSLGLLQVTLHSPAQAALACLAGVLLLVPAAALLRGLALARAYTVRFLLGPTEDARSAARFAAAAAEQRAARAAAVRTHEADHRRIERDLHDGAQVRMVAVTMGLGRARRKFADDPRAALALLDQAYEDSRGALAELRALVRGIHPPILTDRGLDAAISSLAAASGLRVEAAVDLPARLPAPVESAAYFLIAECLSNVAKHTRAGAAGVRVAGSGGHVVVEVTDDGPGGADPAAGTGLAGLRDRVRAVGGHLHVDSPHGGPTTVRGELPCAS